MNQLDARKQFTTVVADTGDFRQLAQFQPQSGANDPDKHFGIRTEVMGVSFRNERIRAFAADAVQREQRKKAA